MSVLYFEYVTPWPILIATMYFCFRSCPLLAPNVDRCCLSVDRAIWLMHSFSNSYSMRHACVDIVSHSHETVAGGCGRLGLLAVEAVGGAGGCGRPLRACLDIISPE